MRRHADKLAFSNARKHELQRERWTTADNLKTFYDNLFQLPTFSASMDSCIATLWPGPSKEWQCTPVASLWHASSSILSEFGKKLGSKIDLQSNLQR